MIKVYGNVVGESLDGNFTSDILNLDIDNQSADILMNSNEQVNINLKKWKKVSRIIKFKKNKPIFELKDISKSFDGRPI